MNDFLKKVSSGDPLVIPARAYNAFIDAAKYAQQQQGGTSSGGMEDGSSATIVHIQNSTGDTVPKFGVLAFSGTAVIDPGDDEDSFLSHKAALDGSIPSLPDDAGRFAITLDEADDGEIVPAVAAGIVRVQIDVADEDDTFAEAIDGDVEKLESSADSTPTQIIWKEAGTGVKWGIVRLGNNAGGSIDLLNGTNTVVLDSPFLATGTNILSAFRIATTTIGGTAGAKLEGIKGSNRAVLQWNGDNLVADWVRSHP